MGVELLDSRRNEIKGIWSGNGIHKKSLESRTIPGISQINFYQLFLLGCGV
jgi:hypothetical protein